MASLPQLVSSRPRDSKETFLFSRLSKKSSQVSRYEWDCSFLQYCATSSVYRITYLKHLFPVGLLLVCAVCFTSVPLLSRQEKKGNPVAQCASTYQFSVALLTEAGCSLLINYIYLNWTRMFLFFVAVLNRLNFSLAEPDFFFFRSIQRGGQYDIRGRTRTSRAKYAWTFNST